MNAGAMLLPLWYSPAAIGITVQEQTASPMLLTAAKGNDSDFLLAEPRYLSMASRERKTVIAAANRNVGMRHVKTW